MNNEKTVKHDTNGDCFHKINSHVLDKMDNMNLYIKCKNCLYIM